MKIHLDELRAQYAANIMDRTSLNRTHCPSSLEINECLRGTTSKKAKNHLAEHFTNCCFCLEEFQFVLEIQRHEREMTQEIGLRYNLHSHRLQKPAGKIVAFAQIRESLRVFRVKKVRFWASVTAILLLLASGTLYVSRNWRQAFRSSDLEIIKPLHPIQKKVRNAPLHFRWRNWDQSEYFIVELFDETLYPLWKSPKLLRNSVRLPINIEEKLSPGASYFWFVTGFTVQGKKVESPLIFFQMKK